ncbi:MAG: 3-methyladenine DNA glycosylase 2 [Clostridiaceae bacterium]|nr:3-methyladenine DNA glycosylase 2 [Clostridiaceae bacterium]
MTDNQELNYLELLSQDLYDDEYLVSLTLPYLPPYRWDELIAFLDVRTIEGVETVLEGVYYRTVRMTTEQGQSVTGWLGVDNDESKQAIRLTLTKTLQPVLPQIVLKTGRMFDLDCNPHEMHQHLSKMNKVKSGIYVPGTRVPGSFDVFEMSVRAVLGQQITVKAAQTIAGRFAQKHGTPIQTNVVGLTHIFPTPAEILELEGSIADHLGPLGVTGRRSQTILALAEMIEEEKIDFSTCGDAESKIKELIKIPGIGPWTAHYIAMRTFKWPDAFPSTDYGVKKVLEPRTQKEITALAENWRPWRAYATINLWNSLSEGKEDV